MTTDALVAQLKEVQEQASDQHIRELVFAALTDNREEAVKGFSQALGEINAALRKKLLETLIEDGGEDLIPLYIETIRKEPNLIHAKSALFQYGNFEHQAALDALLALQEEIRPQLEPVWRKTSSILKARFKEYYAVWLFKNGLKDPSRLEAAREMMIQNPHPSYLPFLNRIIAESRYLHRLRGVEILGIIGNRSSMAPMFRLLPRVFKEVTQCNTFYKFLVNPAYLGAESLTQYLAYLSEASGWPEGEAEKLMKDVRQEKVWSTLVRAREGFQVPDSEFWDEASQFLRSILLNKERDDRTRARLDSALENFVEEQHDLADALCTAMGHIGGREEVPNLLARFIAQLPDDEVLRDNLTVAFLGSFRGEEGRELLLELLQPDKPAALMHRVLRVLEDYSFDKVPDQVLNLIVNPSDIDIRKKAQALLVRCGNVEAVLETLMEHKSVDIRTDTIELIAERKLEAGYSLLLNQLTQKIPHTVTEKVITALGAFAKDRHAAPVMSFLTITFPYSVRRAAMTTLLLSTEKRRFAMVVASISQYQPRSRVEMQEMLVTVLANLKLPPGIEDQSSFWEECLNAQQEAIRLGSLEVLDRVTWNACGAREKWVKMLKITHGKHANLRTEEEREQLDALREKIESLDAPEEKPEDAKSQQKKLSALLDKLEAGPDRGRAFRHFNLVFKPPMLHAAPDQADRLNRLVLAFVEAHQDDPTQLGFLKNLLVKIGDKGLIHKVAGFLTTPADDQESAPQTPDPKPPADPENQTTPAATTQATNASETKAGNNTPEPPKQAQRPGPIKKVLIMDDSVVFSKALQRVLKEEHFEVVAESVPARGLLALSRGQFDLLLLDYAMPGMNGISFLAEARKRKNMPPRTIFITSSRDRNELTDMMSAGVDALLLKPFPAADLLQKIKTLQPE